VFATTAAFGEACLYAVLGPLLPSIARDIHLSDPEAGLLSAAYPAGMFLGTLPAGLAAARRPRATAICGMWLVTLSCLGFALGQDGGVLTAARLLQGAGAAAAWAGALAWIIREGDPGARGALIGTTLGAGFAGTVVAPVLAAIASTGRRTEVFLALSLLLGAVAAWGGPADPRAGAASPAPRDCTASGARHRNRGGRSRLHSLVAGARGASGHILMLLVGTVSGISASLSGLILASLGVRGGTLAAVYLCAYGPQAVLSKPIGRISDRHGPKLPLAWCLALLAAGLPAVPFITSPIVAAVLVAVITSTALAGLPLTTVMVSERAERHGRPQGMAMALVNGAWGVGAALGAAASTSIAGALGAPAAYIPAGAACLIAAVRLARARRRPA
jgi:DHA1 family chloramphenicol resistance protein-like MFS transporter